MKRLFPYIKRQKIAHIFQMKKKQYIMIDRGLYLVFKVRVKGHFNKMFHKVEEQILQN
jgi:hypothetical protein